MKRRTKRTTKRVMQWLLIVFLLSVLLTACQGQRIVIPWQGKTIEIVPRGAVSALETIEVTSTNTPFMPILDSEGQPGLTAAAVQQLSTATETQTGTPALLLMSETLSNLTGTITSTPSITVSGTLPTRTITFTVTHTKTPSLMPTVTRTNMGTLVLSTATPSRTVTNVATQTRTQTQEVKQNTSTFTKTSVPPTSSYTLAPGNTLTITAVVANTSTFTATTVPSGCVYNGNSGYESTLIGLINDLRTSLGLTPYSSNGLLGNAARGHSQDMACNDYFSHTGLDGSTAASRVAAEGYSYSWVGENIYAGSGSYGTPQMAYNYWFTSPAHYANMTNTNYTEIGIGFISCADSMYQNYFTANFARP